MQWVIDVFRGCTVMMNSSHLGWSEFVVLGFGRFNGLLVRGEILFLKFRFCFAARKGDILGI